MTSPNILIVGAGGRLGAPMLAVMAAAGLNVFGADVDQRAVIDLNGYHPPARVNEPGLAELLAEHRPRAIMLDDLPIVDPFVDVAYIVVPTPSGPDDRFDDQHVRSAAVKVAAEFVRRRPGMGPSWHPVIVIVSTVMPGACQGVIECIAAHIGLTEGVDYSLVYSPAFIALGSVINDLRYPDVVYVGASQSRGHYLAAWIAEQIAPDAPRILMSRVDAEIAKLALNVALSVKIGYANTVARLCETIPGADARNVLEAVGLDARIGDKLMRHGGPPSGPCLPRDLRAIATLLHDLAPDTLVTGAQAASDDVVRWVVEQVAAAVSEPGNAPVRVGLLGLGYKPESGIIDDSLGWRVALDLIHAGYYVSVHDPFIADGAYPHGAEYMGIMYAAELPVVVVATAHDCYRSIVAREGQTVIDVWSFLDGNAGGTMIRPGVGPTT